VELVYTAGVQTGVHMFAIDVKTGFSKTRNTLFFHGMGTENLRHQFSHLFDHISECDIRGFVLQHNSEVYKFISAAVDLFG
jgi:glycogen synthase